MSSSLDNSSGGVELPVTEEQKVRSTSLSTDSQSTHRSPPTNITSPSPSPPRGTTVIPRSIFDCMYIHEAILGRGGQGRVDRYLIKGTGKTVAVKSIISAASINPAITINEVRILTYLNTLPGHANISRMTRIWDHGSELRIVMPCYPGGDLLSLANRATQFECKIPEAFCFHVFFQVASGVSFLHEHGISHRDIKPQNLLLDPNTSSIFPDLKIVDYGCAETRLDEHSERVGTANWQPPSFYNLGAKADVWGVGASIYFLCTGAAPKPALSAGIQRLVADIEIPAVMTLTDARNATFDSLAPLPVRGYSPLLEYYVSRTLDTNSANRISSHALIANLQVDAVGQIEFYLAWVAECDKRPMMQFIYPEPPAGWIPGRGIVQ